MNYFALCLNNESYIEKCIILLKYLSMPKSKSLPHITLRLFKELNQKFEYIKNKKFSYLNIIEPGTFNFDEPNSSYVVYLRCESEELEEIDYRPDYPFSRLHITLYEGQDLSYAKALYSLLRNESWHFKLKFDRPKRLSENELGNARMPLPDYNSIYKEILGEKSCPMEEVLQNDEYCLETIKQILNEMSDYLSKHRRVETRVTSLYFDKDSTNRSNNYIDESKTSNSLVLNDQLIIDGVFGVNVEKPVRDAIFVTPPEYARDMAVCALEAYGDDSIPIRFGDSAIGTGALFIAIKRIVDNINETRKTNYTFESAVGIDIDEKMAEEAYLRCNKRGLTIIYGDAISAGIDLGEKRNLMLVNPPYNRHNNIPVEYRNQAKDIALEQTGISIPAGAGLFVYHMLIMDKWLDDEGIAVWLIPSYFLQTKYGKAIRQYLTTNVSLIRLHIYDEEKVQFDDTDISTTIVVFKKRKPSDNLKVSITYGESIDKPDVSAKFEIDSLRNEIDNWRKLLLHTIPTQNCEKISDNVVRFSQMFDIKRGIATGANKFFVMDRSMAREKGIPEIALKPLLPKARFLESTVIEACDDGYPNVSQQNVLIDCDLKEDDIRTKYPEFYEYLQTAKVPDKDGETILDKTLIKGRKPWYKQEIRTPPMFLLTYMGRKKDKLPALYFIYNKSKAIALNTYLLLYPKPWLSNMLEGNDELCKDLLCSLNESATEVIMKQTRIYAGGLHKLEPNELKDLIIINVPESINSRLNMMKVN